ncbi:MAG: nuclear transport factor 2 family protein [Geminicoccaceae bacterium]|nr:nuclear transport factor 2 family protein [Geminicoccaceae bacterium]
MDTVTTSAGAAELKALFEAFNRHDAEAVMAFMTGDCVFETVAGPEAYGTRIEGRDAVKDAFAEVFETFPDAHWETSRHTVVGDLGVSEWTFRGTRRDGARIEAEGCDLFTFRGDKIALKRAFRKQRPLLST